MEGARCNKAAPADALDQALPEPVPKHWQGSVASRASMMDAQQDVNNEEVVVGGV
jgi:hypothetical protein